MVKGPVQRHGQVPTPKYPSITFKASMYQLPYACIGESTMWTKKASTLQHPWKFNWETGMLNSLKVPRDKAAESVLYV